MAKENDQSCKCPFSCNRRGDCTACKEYHLKDNSKTYCVKSNNEKKFDRDQAHIAKITSVPSVKIPDVDTTKSMFLYQDPLKNKIIPAGIINFANTIKSVVNTTSQLYKAFMPDIQKAVGIVSEIGKIFEEYMRNQYIFKHEIIEKWNNLETELKTRNRYFPKSDLLVIFEKCIEEAKYILPKGKYLFRARKFDLDELSTDVENIIKKATDHFNDYQYQKSFDKKKDIWDYIKNISQDKWKKDYMNDLKIPKIYFWGYNAKQSDAPPGSKTIPGRANPVGISYLYTANSVITAISEIQPTIGQMVSVAKIKTLKDLNLFNFNFYEAFNDSELFEKPAVEIKEKLGLSVENMEIFFDTISELFSKPSLGHTDNYYATQYISEFIKNQGFDGIIFNSSLNKNGVNYVLFDTSKNDTDCSNNYKIVSSSLHRIDNVSISVRKIFPKRSKPNSK